MYKNVFVIAEQGEVKEVGVWLDFMLHKNSDAVRLIDVASGFDYTISNALRYQKNIPFSLGKFYTCRWHW